MSSTGSRDSSSRGSPYSSNNDLMDDDLYNDKPMKKSRGKRGADHDEIEQTIYKAQQDAEEFTTDYQQFRNANQSHTKRIQEMMSQFDDARSRIDKLLQRYSSPRDYDADLRYSSPKRTSRTSMSVGRISVNSMNGEIVPSPTMVHKSSLTVNPLVSGNKPIFGTVSLRVKVDD